MNAWLATGFVCGLLSARLLGKVRRGESAELAHRSHLRELAAAHQHERRRRAGELAKWNAEPQLGSQQNAS